MQTSPAVNVRPIR